ncbi:MAG: MFS transporter [Anaerolineae bacterium]|nr:MFS transporter [Anaerolineae bacterium]
MRHIHWSAAPDDATPVQRRNFINVQVDAIGIGLATAAGSFLPVFLTRLGATSFQVGLLTAMPAFTGLFFAIAIGAFLQSRRNIVPWFSAARLMVVMSYALTGIVPFVVPRQYVVQAILALWMAVTVPQTVVSVAFSVVMNAVAGPRGRYALMSRRWAILGLTNSLMVILAGWVLDRIDFPLNYQVVFIALSAGGLISYYFSSHIVLPDAAPQPRAARQRLSQRLQHFANRVLGERPFLSFTTRQFIYNAGLLLAAPLFPIYFVRTVHASDAWIGTINSVQTFVTLFGYFFWAQQGRTRGSRSVLLWTTAGLALYPALVASTRRVELIVLFAGLAGFFQAGLNLVFFDELMKTVPVEQSATFVAVAQSLQHFSSVVAPLAGTALADHGGIHTALAVSTLIRLVGCGLFAVQKWGKLTRVLAGLTVRQPGCRHAPCRESKVKGG